MEPLKPSPRLSNYERVRAFRSRNPGYDARRMAKLRAAGKVAIERARAAAVNTPAAPQLTPSALPAPAVIVPVSPGRNTFELPTRQPVSTFIPASDSVTR